MLLASVAFCAKKSILVAPSNEKEHITSSLSQNQKFIETIQSLIDLTNRIAPTLESGDFEKIKNKTASQLEIDIFLKKIGYDSQNHFLFQQKTLARNLNFLKSSFPKSFENIQTLQSEIKDALKIGKLNLKKIYKNEDCFLNFMAMLALCGGVGTIGDGLIGKEEDSEYSGGTAIGIWALCVAAAWVYLTNCEG